MKNTEARLAVNINKELLARFKAVCAFRNIKIGKLVEMLLESECNKYEIKKK